MTTHLDLCAIVRALPSDCADCGGTIERWADESVEYPDCSVGCRWAAWLRGSQGNDWCVCTNPKSPRAGLLTFEHQAGFGYFEAERRRRKAEGAEFLGQMQ